MTLLNFNLRIDANFSQSKNVSYNLEYVFPLYT